jgi:predicted negative regulator of RcsB-dependent stress response
MDEEITIIDTNTRNERIRNFFIKNKKKIIIIISFILISILIIFSFMEVKKKNRVKLSNQFNTLIINFEAGEKKETISKLKSIVKDEDNTYSPLALYFLIDNSLIENKDEVNDLFDILINKTKLETEIKNLIIYKKALYNSDLISENDLIKMLNPIIKSKSIWKSHSLYLIAEYFYSKNEMKKAKEFFIQIITTSNSNSDIKIEAQKRLNRDLGE